MSKERQETIAEIVREMLNLGRLDEKSTDKITRSLQALGLRTYADRIEAAAKREVAELKSKMNDVVCENEALREACGTCCAKRYVAELRECLKEAIREKCPFTRMSCKHGEPCDYECGTIKWRNALRNEGSEK